MVIDALDDVLVSVVERGLRPAMIYTIATYHSPTGTVMPLAARRRLLETAARHGALVLDDNCYYHLWYDAPPPESLLALDDGATVIQSGSFSKYLAPGLRMAWLAAAPAHIEAIAAARQDFAVSQVTARVVERFVRRGELDDHLAVLRAAYEEKRDAVVAALRRHCGDLVTFEVPRGGLYVWLRIDDTVDMAAAMARCDELGVTFRPGVRFQHGADGASHLRLSVAQSPLHDIEPGIALLGVALKESLR
jgi:2-aminoadipate transaminase